METINWVEHEQKASYHSNKPNLVAYCLLEAMAEASEQKGIDLTELFTPFKPEALQVEFKVNGVDLSFTGCMDKIQKAISSIEEDVERTLKPKIMKQIISKLELDLYYSQDGE